MSEEEIKEQEKTEEQEETQEQAPETQEQAPETQETHEERKMYKAICSECGKETEVPFKPDPDRPVYCKECFQKKRRKRFGGDRRSGRFNRGGYNQRNSDY